MHGVKIGEVKKGASFSAECRDLEFTCLQQAYDWQGLHHDDRCRTYRLPLKSLFLVGRCIDAGVGVCVTSRLAGMTNCTFDVIPAQAGILEVIGCAFLRRTKGFIPASGIKPFLYCSAPDRAAAITSSMFSVCPGPGVHLFAHW